MQQLTGSGRRMALYLQGLVEIEPATSGVEVVR
jgi:hypothetical protein